MEVKFITRVMKGAAVVDLSTITFPKLASPKIDGFRCTVSDEARTSRFKRFPNKHVHKKLRGLLPPGILLDGEIVVGKRRGKGVLGRTSSGVTSEDGKPDWRFWVFDAPRLAVRFEDRLRLAKLQVKQLAHPQVKFVKHEWIETLEELQAYIEACLEAGFEGVMLRDPEGPYKEGKSTLRQQWLLKIKPFEDREGRVIGYFEEMENTNEAVKDATGKSKRSSAKAGKVPKGCLGGLILEDVETKVEVRVGGGFTRKQRVDLWAIREQLGKGQYEYVTYKKQLVGEKDKPRHPVFKAFRHLIDIDKDTVPDRIMSAPAT